MPLIDLQIASNGPVVSLAIGLSSHRIQALRKLKQPVPAQAFIAAVVDTGAGCTCIDKRVIASLALPPIGQIPIHTPSTGAIPIIATQYDVSVVLIDANNQPHMMANALPVIEADLSPQGIEGLFGRDILRKCFLVYNGPSAAFTLAY